MRRRPSSSFLQSMVLLGILTLAVGCGVGGPFGGSTDQQPLIGQNCRVAADQRGAFNPPILLAGSGARKQPATVVIDPRFTAEQRQSIQLALAQWNAYSNPSLGHDLFRPAILTVTGDVIPENENDCDFGYSGPDRFMIVREESDRRWNALSLTDQNPGMTLRCHRDQKLTRQVVMIHTRHASQSQLASIVVHELGHAAGLDHSCQPGEGSSDWLSCSGMMEDHPYRQAVMFPVLRIGTPGAAGLSPDGFEIKDSLRSNDMERAQCLYSR